MKDDLRFLSTKLQEIQADINDLKEDKESSRAQKKYMTLKEASEVYAQNLKTLRRKASKREIPMVKQGKNILIPVKQFERWLARNSRSFEG